MEPGSDIGWKNRRRMLSEVWLAYIIPYKEHLKAHSDSRGVLTPPPRPWLVFSALQLYLVGSN